MDFLLFRDQKRQRFDPWGSSSGLVFHIGKHQFKYWQEEVCQQSGAAVVINTK